MNKEFAPYELALALKELGFDEPCFGWYAENKNLQISPDVYKKWTSKPCNNSNIIIVFNSDCVTAPTFSQAFRWFREKCLLEGIVEQADDFYWYKFSVYFYGKEGKQKISNGLEFKTYEEAELACLIKLIEIVKNK
jgi:hypothetical protein